MKPNTVFVNNPEATKLDHLKGMIQRMNLALVGYALAIGLIFSLGMAIHAFAVEQREQASHLQARVAGEIIRFHVVADSDRTVDQALKSHVQSSVLQLVSELTADSQDREATRQVVLGNLPHILRYAQLVANRFASTAELEGLISTAVSGGLYVRYFPEIQYANLWLPSGYYEALTLRIGSGSGSNWWCVMFPMLCLLDEQPTATPELQAILREVLSEAEYQALFEPTVTVRFRSVDLWQNR